MELRELLFRISREYDRTLGFSSPAQQLLKDADQVVSSLIPAGYEVQGSGGRGNTATIPWIAVFDPDETTTARQGMYVVYLFSEDGRTVHLTLNQGVTEITQRWGRRAGREKLELQASVIHDAIAPAISAGFAEVIDLRSRQPLALDYQAGVILGRTYTSDSLADEDHLQNDLREMIQIYQVALTVRERLRSSKHHLIASPPKEYSPVDGIGEFKPKDDSDYLQVIEGRVLRKSRKHESLVRQYGDFLRGQAFVVATNVHPRDFTIERGAKHWVAEAKIVPRGNGVSATRDALGQLLFYRRFHYPNHKDISMLALFNEPIGPACVEFLEELMIAAVWREDGQWRGSRTAQEHGLC